MCKTSGVVPVPSNGFARQDSNVSIVGRCHLCWGVGCLPLLEAFKDPIHQDPLALHYWECYCASPGDGSIANYHPDIHDFCPKCQAQQDDCMSAVPMLVQDWLTDLGAMNVEIVWVEQDGAEPAPAYDEPVQKSLFQAVDAFGADVYVIPPRSSQTIELDGMAVHGVDDDQAALLQARQAFTLQFFDKRGWDFNQPAPEQIEELRRQDEWINPLVSAASRGIQT
jgi:hypothetical protein